jgi:hypothetical protein
LIQYIQIHAEANVQEQPPSSMRRDWGKLWRSNRHGLFKTGSFSIYIFWFILGNTHKHIYIYVCENNVMFFFWLAGFNQPHPQLSVKSDHQPK